MTMVREVVMRTIKASEFKARCLKLMDEVAASGESLFITRNGKPVAQLGPVGHERRSIWGPAQRPDRDSRRHHRADRCRVGAQSLILLGTHCPEVASLMLKGRLRVRAPMARWRHELLERGIVELPLGGSPST
jgi:prevent-host-death family protein